MDEFELVFYQKSNGDCPVGEFMNSLNNVMYNKMSSKLTSLEFCGNQPKGDFTKNLGDGIFELRAQTKTDISRILFFFDKNRKIVLTNGFVKKTQRLPASEMETAKRYRADYLARTKTIEAQQKDSGHSTNDMSTPKWRPTLEEIMKKSRQQAEMQSKSYTAVKESRGR